MTSDNAYRKPLLKVRQAQQEPRNNWKVYFRESVDTLILGSLSTSIGTVVLIALFLGTARGPMEGWIEAHFVPSSACAITAIIGECLGLAGIFLARHRGRKISLLSALGTLMCLIHMYVFIIIGIFT